MGNKIYDFETVLEYFKEKRPDFKREILEPLRWSLENKVLAFEPRLMFSYGERYVEVSCEERARHENGYESFRIGLIDYLSKV